MGTDFDSYKVAKMHMEATVDLVKELKKLNKTLEDISVQIEYLMPH